MFLAILLVVAGLIALLVPAIVTGTRQLMVVLPDLVHNLARYLKPFGIKVNQADIEAQVRSYGNRLVANAVPLLGGVVRVATGILSGVFETLTIALLPSTWSRRGRSCGGRFSPGSGPTGSGGSCSSGNRRSSRPAA